MGRRVQEGREMDIALSYTPGKISMNRRKENINKLSKLLFVSLYDHPFKLKLLCLIAALLHVKNNDKNIIGEFELLKWQCS